LARPKKAPPETIPIEATQTPPNWIEGRTRLKEVAPNMIPAENPSRLSIIFGDAFFVKKTGMAPNPVANPAPKLASPPNQITFILAINPDVYIAWTSVFPPEADPLFGRHRSDDF
jgi:hypothetical protein